MGRRRTSSARRRTENDGRSREPTVRRSRSQAPIVRTDHGPPFVFLTARRGGMLRPSHVTGRPRESVFISGPLPQENEPVCSPYIEACVAAAQEACEKIHDAHLSLHTGVADLPRMSRVLENERLFTLVNESQVALYQSQLAEEVEPQIFELAERAERGIKNLERKVGVLASKLEAAQSRASSRSSIGTSMTAKKLEMLQTQREAFEKELQSIQDDVDDLEGQFIINEASIH